jgi:hypothetical protein
VLQKYESYETWSRAYGVFVAARMRTLSSLWPTPWIVKKGVNYIHAIELFPDLKYTIKLHETSLVPL